MAQQWLVARAALTDGTSTTLITAPATTKEIRVHFMAGGNSGASVTVVDLKDGTTIKWSFPMGVSGGGFVMPLNRPWILTAGTALIIQQSQSVNSYVSALYELAIA